MAFKEFYRSSVQTWEADTMGHLNIQFYSEKVTSALAALSIALGHGPEKVRATRTRLVATDHHIRFLREQRPGAPMFIRGGVVSAEAERLTCYFEMVGTVSNEVAASFLTEVALVDDDTRETLPLPQNFFDNLDALKIDVPLHGQPRGLTLDVPRVAPTLKGADDMGLIATFQGEVMADWCDATGRLATRRYMGIVSDSIPNLLAQTRGDDRSRDSTTGGAALEYRFIYRTAPRLGDILTLRSGMKEVTPKTYTWAHWLFDVETGTCVATAEAVGIALDLVARKVIPIPAEMAERLRSFVVPGLGV